MTKGRRAALWLVVIAAIGAAFLQLPVNIWLPRLIERIRVPFWGGLVATVAVTVLITRMARRALDSALRQASADPTAPFTHDKAAP